MGKFSEEPGLWDGVGTIDYLIYTVFNFPTGVVDSLVFQEPDFVKNGIRKAFRRKDLEFE